ncbi:hypothetical protein GN956_G9543 [Arapaima gigas]
MSFKCSGDVVSAIVKRKRQSITLASKIEIVNASERPIDVACRLGLPPLSVRTIMQKKEVTKKVAAKAEITKHIFQEYLVDRAIPELHEYCKQENMDFEILLILDNAAALVS